MSVFKLSFRTAPKHKTYISMSYENLWKINDVQSLNKRDHVRITQIFLACRYEKAQKNNPAFELYIFIEQY